MPSLKFQNGIATIEFALSFIFLITLFYGIAGYTMPLLLSASYQQVASDTLRDALVWQYRQQATEQEVMDYFNTAEGTHFPDEASDCKDGKSQFLSIGPAEDSNLHKWTLCLRTETSKITLINWNMIPLPDYITGSAALLTSSKL